MKAINVIMCMLTVLMGLATSPSHARAYTTWNIEVYDLDRGTAVGYVDCIEVGSNLEEGSLSATYLSIGCAEFATTQPAPRRDHYSTSPQYQRILTNDQEHFNCYLTKQYYEFNGDTGFKRFECTNDRIFKNGFGTWVTD